MKHIAMAAFLAAIPIVAFAHGPAPTGQHGGTVAEASDEHWVEQVLSGNQITIYVSTDTNKPVLSAHMRGKATVLIGGKAQQLTLAPAEANSLTGKLDPSAGGKMTSVVSLTIDGRPTQVRFATTQ